MINIENAKSELIKHVQSKKIDSPRVKMKIGHIIRVSRNCEKLAKALNLSREQIELARLIGLLHDIGRFEQYKNLNEVLNNKEYSEQNKILDITKKFDHGEAGVNVLKKDDYIRTYIKDNTYDDIIFEAVYQHNKYEIPKGLSKEKELYCKIIKDADKIDLLYEGVYIYWQNNERKNQVEEGELSPKMLEDFYQNRLADNRNRVSEADQILRFASFVFDINFLKSFEILNENGNIGKMIDKFNYKIPKTKEEMIKVKQISSKYILDKIKEGK